MDRHVDFTYNKKAYAGLPEFVRAVKKDGLRYIIILVRFLNLTFVLLCYILFCLFVLIEIAKLS